MGRTNLCSETCATGAIPSNRGGTHGGISPASHKQAANATAEGSSGNPGTEFPWKGADATSIGFDTALPPLKSL
jgi:hypothetical protein